MKQKGISEASIQYGKKFLAYGIAFGQAITLVEFICYVLLYKSLKEHNKSFFKIVQESILKKRAKRNTITFAGQAITFMMEVLYGILMQVLINFGGIGGFFEPGAIPCALLVLMASLSVTQILTSPPLRRFYLGYD